MRFLLKATMPVERGNDPRLVQKIQDVLADIKPDAAYFCAEHGQRTAYLFVNLEGAHKIPAVAEPLFHAFKADIELIPVMTPEDLQRAAPDMTATIKKYGG
jgi:hypothetical protein